MEHRTIDDERILDRYLAGRLSEEDEALFEEHLFACSDCLAEVQAGDELRRGLRAVAAEDAARATAALGLVAWWRRHAGRFAGPMALLLVLLTAALLWQRSRLDELRVSRTAAFAEPVGNFLVVSLGVVRDAQGGAVEVRPDPEKAAVLLSLELQAVGAERYRVTLRDAGGALLWTGEDLEPNLYDTLLVALPPSFLAPGRYRIQVEGLRPSGVEPAGEMELLVLP